MRVVAALVTNLVRSGTALVHQCSATPTVSSEYGAVDGLRSWLLYACPSVWAIKMEYTTTLDEL